MSKLIIAVSAASPNPYLMPDGMANLDKIAAVGARASQHITADKPGSAQVSGMYYIPRKAKPIKHSATKANKGDLKYLTQRATKVILRKRATDNPNYTLLLPVLAPGVTVPDMLKQQIKQAAAALNQHIRKSETVKGKVGKERAKLRAVEDKAFQASLKSFKEILRAGGVKDTDIVESKGIFGRTVLVKFGPEDVVSIGKSDLSKFRAAKKAAAAPR